MACRCMKKKKKVFVCSKCPKYSNAFRSREEEIEFYQQKRKQENWNIYQQFLKENKDGCADIQDQIDRFIRSKAGPPWFKQLSDRQMKAADDLLKSIADDVYWSTNWRCQDCLQRIGIFPIHQDTLNPITRMSRGNDLSFLWFFLQTVHQSDMRRPNTCDKKAYSLNEKLILSAICHLDMMTTMRQLDKMLPELMCEEKQCKRVKIGYMCDIPSPYLRRIPIPKLPRSIEYDRPIIPRLTFAPYNRYKNPKFVIKNEKNRWFAYMKELPKEKTSAEKIVDDILDEEINKVPAKFDRMQLMNNILLKNKKFEEKRQVLFDALSEVTKCCCKEYGKTKKAAARSKRVIFQLDLEMAKNEEEFNKYIEEYQKQTIVRTILHSLISDANDTVNIQICDETDKCIESFCEYKKYIECENKPPPCCQYFNKPTKKSPYKFNYEKIFTNDVRSALSSCPFANAIHKALNLDKYCTVDQAIKVCLNEMWQYELELWNEKYNPEYICKEIDDVFGKVKYIDVCDRDTAFKLLEVGLRKLQRNTKYVLAYLPDAHLLPVLREWVLDRYGFRYDYKYRKLSITTMMRFWDYMLAQNQILKVPKIVNIIDCDVDQKKLTWDEKEKYSRIIRRAVQKTYRYVKDWAVSDATRFWETMEPYLCFNKSPPVATYFAYLPGSPYHVLPRRPWQTSEYREM